MILENLNCPSKLSFSVSTDMEKLEDVVLLAIGSADSKSLGKSKSMRLQFTNVS